MIQKAFVDESMGIAQIKEWQRRFKNGRTSVDSDPRSGRPSLTTTPENIERVRLAIEGDRRLTVRELENDLGIPKTTVWEILNKILGTVVCDESWVYGYDPETIQQYSQWKRPDEPQPKKARHNRSHVKLTLIILKSKFDTMFFLIFYNREIKLSIFIVKFIRSISKKNHTINILSVSFALFIQFTVLLPKCYPIVTEMCK